MSIALEIEDVVSEYMLAMKTTKMYGFEFSLTCDAIRGLPEGKDIIILSNRDYWRRFKSKYHDIFNIEECEDDFSIEITLNNHCNHNSLRRHFTAFMPTNLHNSILKALTREEFKRLAESKKLEHKESIGHLEKSIKNKYASILLQKEQKLKELHREVKRLRTAVKELNTPQTTH
ncbi:MAG: hypothetical protein LBT45_02270 [Rickettsiales bacterium]|jgi:hypothetical protein|nr:hypothetical protein [Rickettsiales bacterium]